MAYSYIEDGTSSSRHYTNRGQGVFKKPTINTAVGGIIQNTAQLATIGGIAYAGLKAINSANEE